MAQGNRQRLVRLLRRLRLLSFISQVRFLSSVIRRAPENRAFRRANPDLVLPSQAALYETSKSVSLADYYNSGQELAGFFADLIRTHLPERRVRVLEWGSGVARVLRHLPGALSDREVEACGTDYNRRLVAWSRRSLPSLRFELNDLEPPLPFEENSFDVIYSISVFTHLSERMHEAWRDELRRVLRPGGLLITTLAGEHFRGKLLPKEVAQFDAGELVVRGQVEEGRLFFAAFHPEPFVRERLFRGLPILEHWTPDRLERRGLKLRQDVWVVRNESAADSGGREEN